MPKKTGTKRKNALEARLELRMTTAEKKAFQEAADRQEITLSMWLRLAAKLVIAERGGKVQIL